MSNTQWLDRILNTPHLAHVVPRLPADVLHRVIQSSGLEACGELVALATPGQLAAVFDLDLWRAGQPGRDEQFDPHRFGVWLEVLLESGAAAAAHVLAGVDARLVIAALAAHVRVFDPAATTPAEQSTTGSDIGGYLVAARQTDSWDAITAVLVALDAEHGDYFHRVMRGCRSLSNSAPEVDGLDDLLGNGEQVMFDLALDRERRREARGYVTPAQARAFLRMSRELRLGRDAAPTGNPLARAYFRTIEEPAETAAPEATEAAVAAVFEVLAEAGVLPQPPRALLDGAREDAPRLARMRAQLAFAGAHDPAACSIRSQELAYLANTIMAGCSIQARPFTAQEASDAAVAVCNLGLENWPLHWLPTMALPDDFLVGHDLVRVFQVGWTVLHQDVGMYAAGQLIDILTRLQVGDREIQADLDALRLEMTRHRQAGTPWRARDALDVIAILDMPAWAALLGLTDECPVMHAGIHASRSRRTRAVSASAFEFISENSQIAIVREFMQALPATLRL